MLVHTKPNSKIKNNKQYSTTSTIQICNKNDFFLSDI